MVVDLFCVPRTEGSVYPVLCEIVQDVLPCDVCVSTRIQNGHNSGRKGWRGGSTQGMLFWLRNPCSPSTPTLYVTPNGACSFFPFGPKTWFHLALLKQNARTNMWEVTIDFAGVLCKAQQEEYRWGTVTSSYSKKRVRDDRGREGGTALSPVEKSCGRVLPLCQSKGHSRITETRWSDRRTNVFVLDTKKEGSLLQTCVRLEIN